KRIECVALSVGGRQLQHHADSDRADAQGAGLYGFQGEIDWDDDVNRVADLGLTALTLHHFTHRKTVGRKRSELKSVDALNAVVQIDLELARERFTDVDFLLGQLQLNERQLRTRINGFRPRGVGFDYFQRQRLGGQPLTGEFDRHRRNRVIANLARCNCKIIADPAARLAVDDGEFLRSSVVGDLKVGNVLD